MPGGFREESVSIAREGTLAPSPGHSCSSSAVTLPVAPVLPAKAVAVCGDAMEMVIWNVVR